MQLKKERNYLFDNMKVVLIFFVVSAHYIRISGSFDPATFAGFFYIIAFSFIMQGFLFVSGYFSKNTDKCRKGAVKNFLVPYILLMPVMFCVRLILFGNATLDLMNPSHALWFLLVMFVYRFLIKDLEKIPGILYLSFAMMLLSGCFTSLGEELALGRICSFLIFFILGFKLKWDHIEKIRRIPKIYIILIFMALLEFSYFVACTELIPVEMWHLKDGYSIYHMSNGMGMLIRFILAVVSVAWLVVIINLVPDRKVFFSEIGQRTITIYVLHIPVRYFIKEVTLPGDGNILTYALVFILTVATLYFCSRPAVHQTYNKAMDFVYDKIIGSILEILECMKRGLEDGVKSSSKR